MTENEMLRREVAYSATLEEKKRILESRLQQCNDTLTATARLRDEYRDRAERAEAALAEAQERALQFEKLLKVEEARRDGEPVLSAGRILETAWMVLHKEPHNHGDPDANARRDMAKYAIRLFQRIGGRCGHSPYHFK